MEYDHLKVDFHDKSVSICSTNLIIIKNEKNYGFAEGNNIGIKFSLDHINPDFILLLNNDTVVERNFLSELILRGDLNKNIGIIGAKIYYYNDPNRIWCIGGEMLWKSGRGKLLGNNEIDKRQFEDIREVEHVSGCAFLIKTEVIRKIGLMDRKFFMYYEETDLTIRAFKLGYKSIYVPQAKLWHKVSKSGGGISKEIGLYYIVRNKWLFMKKWSKKSDYTFFVIYQLLVASLMPLFLSIYYRNRKLLIVYYKGLFDGIFLKGT